MRNEFPHRGITMHKLPVGGNIPGIVFAMGSILILLLAIPALWFVTIAAIAAGFAVAGILRLIRLRPEEPLTIMSGHSASRAQKNGRGTIYLKHVDW